MASKCLGLNVLITKCDCHFTTKIMDAHECEIQDKFQNLMNIPLCSCHALLNSILCQIGLCYRYLGNDAIPQPWGFPVMQMLLDNWPFVRRIHQLQVLLDNWPFVRGNHQLQVLLDNWPFVRGIHQLRVLLNNWPFVRGIHQLRVLLDNWPFVRGIHQLQVLLDNWPFVRGIHQLRVLLDNWPFVRGIHALRVNCPQGPMMQSFDVFCVVRLRNLLNHQMSCQWFEMPLHPCDLTVIVSFVDSFHWALWWPNSGISSNRYCLGWLVLRLRSPPYNQPP